MDSFNLTFWWLKQEPHLNELVDALDLPVSSVNLLYFLEEGKGASQSIQDKK